MRQKIKSITKGNARLPAKQKGDNVNYKRIATEGCYGIFVFTMRPPKVGGSIRHLFNGYDSNPLLAGGLKALEG